MRRDREYPKHPLVGVGALIHKNGRILLIRRKFEPNRGRWVLPGGLVEVGERLEEAVRREMKEELGLDIELEGLMEVANEIIPDEKGRVRFHYVLVDYLARPGRRRVNLNKESYSYRWFHPDAVERLNASQNTKAIVGKFILRTAKQE